MTKRDINQVEWEEICTAIKDHGNDKEPFDIGAHLREAGFSEDINKIVFSKTSKLKNLSFRNLKFSNCDFSDVEFENIFFSNISVDSCKFKTAKWNNSVVQNSFFKAATSMKRLF